MRAWQTIDRADTPEGPLELRRRGEGANPADAEYVITVGGRVLMNGAAHQTEDAVAEAACRPVIGRRGRRSRRTLPPPRVLVGGLGMGYTLRAALDLLPRAARVLVAEIDPTIVRWCRGPLAPLTGNAAGDRRVTIEIADVAAVLARTARKETPPDSRFDAVILDLYEGPREAHGGREDPLWGRAALETTRDALLPGGILAVWSEDPDAAFEKRLAAAGFAVERRKPGKGGPRHVVYVGRKAE